MFTSRPSRRRRGTSKVDISKFRNNCAGDRAVGPAICILIGRFRRLPRIYIYFQGNTTGGISIGGASLLTFLLKSIFVCGVVSETKIYAAEEKCDQNKANSPYINYGYKNNFI